MRATRCIFQKLEFPSRRIRAWWNCRVSFSSETSLHIRESDLSFLCSTSAREGNLCLGYCLHATIIKNPPSPFANTTAAHVIYNSLVHLYCKQGELRDAVKLFDDMPLKDTISWNSLISGFLKLGQLHLGFGYFKSLLNSRVYRFDHASLTSVVSVCAGIESLRIVEMVHALVILSGYDNDVTVGNALTTSYFKCESLKSGMRVFDEMEARNVVSWTAAISGLAQNEFYSESLKLFVEMYNLRAMSPNYLTYLSALSACAGLQAMKEGDQIHGVVWKLGIQTDLCIECALMDLYSKCSYVAEAWKIFESAEMYDEVSVTVILAGFAQNGFEEEAIQIFVKMVKTGSKVDASVISSVLGVFGVGTSQGLGLQVHSLVIKKGFNSNIFVNNGLINMYSKSGELEESIKVFVHMPQKNQVSWNSMIAAFARHGDGLKALALYEEMRLKGVKPTDVTFLSLIHACSHVGLLRKGIEFLESMENEYEMQPRMEHYACVVDMFGRAGLLKEAKSFIEGLAVKPDVLVWQALLGACSIYNDIDMGKYAAEQVAKAAPDSPVPYISMANIYSSSGRWKDRARTIKRMKERGVAKETGTSWIEIEKKIHSFVVADEMHPHADDIYGLLLELFGHMRDESESGSHLVNLISDCDTFDGNLTRITVC